MSRLKPAPKVRPEGGKKVRIGVPELPAGKFGHCDGQLAMELALVLPESVVVRFSKHNECVRWVLTAAVPDVEARQHGRATPVRLGQRPGPAE